VPVSYVLFYYCVRAVFDALQIDLPGMPARKKELPTVAEKESTTRTA
jgi:hypothetical protein